jgi:hypothetical protein
MGVFLAALSSFTELLTGWCQQPLLSRPVAPLANKETEMAQTDDSKHDVVVWFEIPAGDFARAGA